jgi:CRISPR-associated endonuclease/helicase Cas3
VARLARGYASTFGAGDWGETVGRWHDLGKLSDAWQAYIRKTADIDAAEEGASRGPDHSTFGAQHAASMYPGPTAVIGHLLAAAIAGHHGGLPDSSSGEDSIAASTLGVRLTKDVDPVEVPPEDTVAPKLTMPFKSSGEARLGFELSFFARMLFSCLVDADRTATEAFCNSPRADQRAQPKPTIGELLAALDAHQSRRDASLQLDPARAASRVNRVRASVLADCVSAAALVPGFFSLNVPTGGGKTLSSLAFALNHASRHALHRVVVAVPFTSIIEQNAQVYRDAIGPCAARGLIEHHSNLTLDASRRQNHLAVENWDAPLIVTTNVQLYESLFAGKTTPCRKLHRLARSVIVLDEAQTIPIDLLRPTLEALRELVLHYGCTIVLCTATQPALEHRADDFEIGLRDVRPIIRDEPALFASLKRVQVERAGRLSDEELADRLATESRVLCVVNTRAHAAKVFNAIRSRVGKSDGCFHLSTLMCAKHRRDVLAVVRQRLRDGKPCRVVSTQLIEAGVDVDFPVVYRAPAGFDSIAQSAGRCNREGRLASGRVVLFESDSPVPPGLLRAAADCARELTPDHPDPLAPASVFAYFKHLYWMRNHTWDKHEVLDCFPFERNNYKFLPFQFRTAAERYRIIREEQTPILVPYTDAGRQLIARALRDDAVDYQLMRDAQPFVVSLREYDVAKLVRNNVVHAAPSGLLTLANPAAYSLDPGLLFDVAGFDPDSTVV